MATLWVGGGHLGGQRSYEGDLSRSICNRETSGWCLILGGEDVMSLVNCKYLIYYRLNKLNIITSYIIINSG